MLKFCQFQIIQLFVTKKRIGEFTVIHTLTAKRNNCQILINCWIILSFMFGGPIVAATSAHLTTTPTEVTTTMEGEVSILLIITVIIGTVLMTSLLVCYICVFRQLCCVNESGSGSGGRRYSHQCSKRSYALRKDSIAMGELTHISSQPTETDRV